MASGNQRRVCDVCGDDTYPFRRMTAIGGGKYACPPDARGYSEEMLADSPAFQLVKQAKPRDVDASREASVIPLYQQSEAVVFNWLTHSGAIVNPSSTVLQYFSHAGGNFPGPNRYVTIENGSRAPVFLAGFGYGIAGPNLYSLGFACMYLWSVINEDRRPKVWIDRAKQVLLYHADHYLQRQFGSPTEDAELSGTLGGVPGPGAVTASTATEYGGFLDRSLVPYIYSQITGLGGLALLRAFQVSGLEKYRTGYRAAMTCLRRMQCYGQMNKRYWVNSSTDVNARWTPGPWSYRGNFYNDGGTRRVGADELWFDDLLALEFVKAVKDVEGDTTYGDTTAVGDFVSATAATLSEMATQAKAFWTSATFDSNYLTSITPLPLPVTPGGPYDNGTKQVMEGFYPFTERNGAVDGVGYFDTDSNATMQLWVYGMRGLYSYFGFDSTVKSLWDFFMSIQPNPSNAVPANAAKSTIFNNHYGTSDMTLCWPQVLNVNTKLVSSPGRYFWPSVGMLAPIWSEQYPSKFVEAKEQMTKRRSMYFPSTATGARDTVFVSLMELGLSGFGYQPRPNFSSPIIHAVDTQMMSQCALAFREDPVIFTTRDHDRSLT